MEARVIGFTPPVLGVEDRFNTFRIGGFYEKRLSPGEIVYLLNEKEKMVFGKAVVEKVEVGKLAEMCVIHGSQNHTELANEPSEAGRRLFATLQKIHGPHIALPTKKTTVIFLKRIE